eukprot:CAMPEP_0119368142 /NCGR_PEP_ID=MMETSP1334-20130426/14832_1 /TAXON_ID=127549 /ORGANISM="Calcidiscus leptoporus, Strain RCC1130" /LENGTH=100 /DNA_ID=CAMNT_0007384715 /DNA_START=206 /DNA_END=505 /DNA_ORIENTATION=+
MTLSDAWTVMVYMVQDGVRSFKRVPSFGLRGAAPRSLIWAERCRSSTRFDLTSAMPRVASRSSQGLTVFGVARSQPFSIAPGHASCNSRGQHTNQPERTP